MYTAPAKPARSLALPRLGERLGALRLGGEEPVSRMVQSLREHGQLTALAAYAAERDQIEVIDGFKRLRAARELGWPSLRVQVLAVDAVVAKAAIGILNERCGLTELEEAWLCRSLYREDRLTQPAIARLLGRHKSWVCRRLLIAEALDETVQADVRLGLLGAHAAQAVARLPRGNQRAVADVAVRRGLTSRQVERLVTAVLECPDENGRARVLQEAVASTDLPPRRRARVRSEADGIVADAGAVLRLAARLQARLAAQPLSALGERAAALVADTLADLAPVLVALTHRIAQVTAKEPQHVAPNHA
jgi:ParB/RepB/Spo0J family partition protein